MRKQRQVLRQEVELIPFLNLVPFGPGDTVSSGNPCPGFAAFSLENQSIHSASTVLHALFQYEMLHDLFPALAAKRYWFQDQTQSVRHKLIVPFTIDKVT
jgi:hypothetical protein